MATTLIDNFSLYGDKPNFARDRVADTEEMRTFDVTTKKYDYGHIVFCVANGKHYKFMYNYTTPPDDSEKDTVTGWFKEFATAEGGSVDLSGYVTDAELAEALKPKVDKVDGKQLSTEDFTTTLKNKLDGIASGAEVNVQSDWNETRTTSDAYIKNKPTIPSAVTESTVSGWGFTKNRGTVTSVKINGVTKSPNTSGVVDLGSIESGGGTTVINGVTDVIVGGVTVVKDNVATIPLASTSSVGVVQLSNAVTSDSNTTAATSAAVKTVNDKVNGTQDAISDIAEIRTNANNAFKGSINGVSEGTLWLVTKVNGKEPNGEGAVTIDVGDKNVQSDWNATSGDAFIKNKPTIPTTLDQLTQSASYRTVTDTEKNTWDAKLDKDTADNSYLGKNDKAASATNADNATNDGNGKNISNTYATKAALSDGLASKQNVIDDLETIRAGAAKGETALQSVPKGYATEDYVDLEVTTLWEVVDQKQDILQDNVNIKTINDESILGNGNITIKQSQSDWTETNSSSDSYIKNKPTFKTINGENILGSGDVSLSNYVTKDMIPLYEGDGIYFNDGDDGNDVGFTINCGEGLSINETTKALQVNTDDVNLRNRFKTINGNSIFGSGNIIANAYPRVDHGTSDTTFTLTPNVFHVWSNVASLSLTLGEGTDGVANEYLFQFSCLGGEVTTLGLPEGIMWANGEVPTLEVLKTYQVSILNNCATYVSFG